MFFVCLRVCMNACINSLITSKTQRLTTMVSNVTIIHLLVKHQSKKSSKRIYTVDTDSYPKIICLNMENDNAFLSALHASHENVIFTDSLSDYLVMDFHSKVIIFLLILIWFIFISFIYSQFKVSLLVVFTVLKSFCLSFFLNSITFIIYYHYISG